MAPLQIIFVLQEQSLHLMVKDHFETFYLPGYGFDADKEITSGPEGNHLFKRTGPIKHMNKFVNNALSRKERWQYGFFFSGREAVFISDRALDNFSIKHFIDLTEQVGSKKTRSYQEKIPPHVDMVEFVADLMADLTHKNIIGSTTPHDQYYHCHYYLSHYYFKEKDNSLDDEDGRRAL